LGEYYLAIILSSPYGCPGFGWGNRLDTGGEVEYNEFDQQVIGLAIQTAGSGVVGTHKFKRVQIPPAGFNPLPIW